MRTATDKGFMILCAEDCDTTRGLIVQIIRAAWPEAEVREARNGQEALASCLAHRPDLLITNVIMPGMSGIELMKELRIGGLEFPAIVTSGYSSAERCEREGVRMCGSVRFLKKPFTEDDVVSGIRSLREAG